MYNNIFINGSGDAVRIQPHNDVPRDMDVFSNTVLASGTGIRVRKAERSAYRQRLTGNVVSGTTPMLGGEAAHNVTLPYQAELLATVPTELTPALLERAAATPDFPLALTRELANYPDWPRAVYPGARVAPALLRTLDARSP